MSTLVLADGSRRPAPDGETVAQVIQSAAPEPGRRGRGRARQRRGRGPFLGRAGRRGDRADHPRIAGIPRSSPAQPFARHGRRRRAAVPRREAGDRAGDRERLLLRFRPGAQIHARGPRADRGGDEARRRGERAVQALRSPARRGALADGVRRPAVQDRADRGLRGGARQLLLERLVHQRLRRAAPAEHGRLRRRVQAAQRGRGVLARRRAQRDAPAHLRHGVLDAAGARRLSEAARGGAQARPPRPRQAVAVVPYQRRRRPGAGALDAEGRRDPRRAGELDPRRAAPARLPERLHAAHRQPRHVPHQRALPVLPGIAVSADRRARDARTALEGGLLLRDALQPDGEGRGGRLPAQADELPAPHPDLPGGPAQLPRPARAAGGVRHGVPLRAVRRAQRDDPRPRLHAGRRAPVLHARSARGRGRVVRRTDQAHADDARPDRRRRAREPARPEVGQVRRLAGELGEGRGEPAARREETRDERRRGRRRGGLLRAED